MSAVVDDENPPTTKYAFGVFKDPDPGFTQTVISVGANFIMSNMLLYGLTGRGKLSYLISMATIPCSVFLCVRDSQKDYDKWKELRVMRLKGVPERFLPYKCKYDWTDFDKKKNQKDLEKLEK
ncbi:unnamed protein product [Auanema sp. JU1783]|nr:unnamed protein product [Auanema sp. JU1783]